MRDSELQELTSEAATVADGLPALQGRQFKGVVAPDGRPRSWFGPPPVFRAIDVLAAVSAHPRYLFARSATNAGSYGPQQDIARLIGFVNADPVTRHGHGHGLGLQPIQPTPAASINQITLRRSFSTPLEVKMEGEYLEAEGVGGTAGCSDQSAVDTEYNESVYADMILPKVEEAVNTAPEYADLRRVYASRVAAEWYRQRSEAKTTAYSEIIDSGDVSAWPARSDWDPKDVFDDYVKSYEEGEFNVERETREGNYIITHTYVYGGVTFFDVPSEPIGATEFAAQYSDLAAATDNALSAPTFDADADTLWFGGRSSERPPWNPYPTPASPLGNPWFWALSTLPVAAWLTMGVFLWWRRRPSAESSPPTPVATGPVAS